MSTVRNYNWRDHAAHVKAAGSQPQPSTLEIERAFMDQAWSYIEPRAGKLMDDPYRLGFEIVSKKEGNTKLCGMSAFRLHGELLYAPVFFLNGQIKGTDLLYMHGVKKFKPFTEDWVTWLIDRSQGSQGSGIDRSESRRHRPTDIHLERIAYPPNMQKYAAAGPVPGIDMSWEEWIKDAHTVVDDLTLNLKDFLQGPGQGWATEKVASLVQTSPQFAQAIHRRFGNDWESLLGPASWVPEAEKSASSSLLVMHRELPEGATEAQVTEFFKRGYYIEDARPQDAMTLVYENGPRDIEEFSDAGFGEVMCSKGEFMTAAVFPECTDEVGTSDCSEDSLSDTAFQHDGDCADLRVIAVTDGGKSCRVSGHRDPIMGKITKNLADCLRDEESWLLDEPSKGSAYVMLDVGAGIVSKPFYVCGSSSRGDVKAFDVCSEYGRERELIINPGVDTISISKGLAGAGAKFIKVKHEGTLTKEDDGYCRGIRFPRDDIKLGSRDSVNDWIFNYGSEMKKLAVSRDANEEFEVEFAGAVVRNLDRVQAFAKLAGDLHMPTTHVEQILDEAFEKGAAHRILEDPPLAKAAGARLQLNDQANFYTGSNDVFGVDQEHPQSFMLGTNSFGQGPEPHRIGDAYDPTLGSGRGNRRGSGDIGGVPEALLFGASPEMISSFSEQNQLPQVFDHGVIGSLTGTYDSGSMIDNFLDDLETALDRLGRILFLLYWKPADFEKDYGTDDMQNLENELLSTFKGYGDLVLNLLKKAKGRNEPSNAFDSMG